MQRGCGELGYVQLDPRGAELLFQIVTEREERTSIAIGTNLPFSEWGTVFPDPRLVAAIVGRVTFNAHILETGIQSYRLATSKTSSRKQPASLERGFDTDHRPLTSGGTGPQLWAPQRPFMASASRSQHDRGARGPHPRTVR